MLARLDNLDIIVYLLVVLFILDNLDVIVTLLGVFVRLDSLDFTFPSLELETRVVFSRYIFFLLCCAGYVLQFLPLTFRRSSVLFLPEIDCNPLH